MRDWIVKDKETVPVVDVEEGVRKLDRLQQSICAVIKGKAETVKLALVALIGKGHLLIEDVPGIGKTTLANALARSLDLSFQRIQFTSDLLPSDVIGVSVFNQQTGDFDWKPGPIFANIVLADEINRATPKTQSSLLEAMAEEQVTVEGNSRLLPEPFMVVATQNPTEHHGTYPLPESQLDRFMLRLHMGYPSNEDERAILRDRENSDPLDYLEPLMDERDILELQRAAKSVRVDESLVSYLLAIVEQTRSSPAVELGASPRGSLSLFNSAQALALVEGRDYCIADDIKRLVIPCFAHRLIVSSQYTKISNRTNESEQILKEILSKTPVPV
ncbi:MAG: MoxR family ATPase [Acidobacteria bacterium]|nr:MAG: MoxR family ATPase [Acidobacteriota bacterium]REK02567.1 MAG: MoxR family ATPase [Acidobacteriota bacterium]REK13630.1 MAG: MoxR family ATPase [Acidobacteriota bacterium]REK41624.1 MAG: MoxR family ATPase [Acidobacteriota bacterium]